MYHPDKQQHQQQAHHIKEFTLKFQAVSAAYQVLMDAGRRSAYDATGGVYMSMVVMAVMIIVILLRVRANGTGEPIIHRRRTTNSNNAGTTFSIRSFANCFLLRIGTQTRNPIVVPHKRPTTC